MRLDQAIIYNGITTGLSFSAGGGPTRGVDITRVRYGDVVGDGYLDKRALQAGLDASDVYLAGRQVFVDAAVYGSTDGDLWDQVQDFSAAFNPQLAFDADSANLGFLPFKFYQATADISTWPTSTYPLGIPLQMYLRPVRSPSFVVEKQATGGGGVSAQGAKQLLAVPLIARDPRKYVQTATSHTINAAASTATNKGDFTTFPTITIISSGTTGTAAIGVGAYDFGITIDAASTTYVLDCAAGTLKVGTTLRMDLLTTADPYPRLLPGANETSRTVLTGLTVTMSYRDAFA